MRITHKIQKSPIITPVSCLVNQFINGVHCSGEAWLRSTWHTFCQFWLKNTILSKWRFVTQSSILCTNNDLFNFQITDLLQINQTLFTHSLLCVQNFVGTLMIGTPMKVNNFFFQCPCWKDILFVKTLLFQLDSNFLLESVYCLVYFKFDASPSI